MYQSYHRDNGTCNTEGFQGPGKYTLSSSSIDIVHNNIIVKVVLHACVKLYTPIVVDSSLALFTANTVIDPMTQSLHSLHFV